jgi:hypothetical protein
MIASAPLCFIKFFAEERYANQFLAGELYLNTLAYFRKIENEAVRDGRFDSAEGVSLWLQPEGTIIKLNAPGIDPIEIASKDLAAPTSISRTYNDYIHVFCLYAVTISNFEVVDGKIRGKAEELQKALTIDKRCFQLGQHAVVINPVLFRKRVREVLKSHGRLFRDKFVTYYDDSTFHGSIPDIESPFWKQVRFSYQREYRVCVYPVVKIDAPVTIKIGDISGFCKKVKAAEIDNLWSFSPAA